VEIGFQHYDVQSFPFESFEDVWFYALMMLLGISRLLEKNANRFKSSSVPTTDVDFKSAQTQTE